MFRYRRCKSNKINKTKIKKGSQFGFINSDGEIIYDNTEIINNEIIIARVIGYIEIRTIGGSILVPLSENITEVKKEQFIKELKEGTKSLNEQNEYSREVQENANLMLKQQKNDEIER